MATTPQVHTYMQNVHVRGDCREAQQITILGSRDPGVLCLHVECYLYSPLQVRTGSVVPRAADPSPVIGQFHRSSVAQHEAEDMGV